MLPQIISLFEQFKADRRVRNNDGKLPQQMENNLDVKEANLTFRTEQSLQKPKRAINISTSINKLEEDRSPLKTDRELERTLSQSQFVRKQSNLQQAKSKGTFDRLLADTHRKEQTPV